MMVVYAGTSPQKLERVREGVLAEIENIRKNGITQEELENTKVQLCAGYVMGRETSAAKMNALGRTALLLGRPVGEEELLGKVQRITMPEIQQAIEYIFDINKMSQVVVQPQTAGKA